MTAPKVDLKILWQILVDLAKNGKKETYGGLTKLYAKETGVLVEPIEWAGWLGECSLRCNENGLPLVSALIHSKSPPAPAELPGDGFYTVPGAPARGRAAWLAYLQEIWTAANRYPADYPANPDGPFTYV